MSLQCKLATSNINQSRVFSFFLPHEMIKNQLLLTEPFHGVLQHSNVANNFGFLVRFRSCALAGAFIAFADGVNIVTIGGTICLDPASSFGLSHGFAVFGSFLWRCFEGSLAAGSRSDSVHGVGSIALSCRR
jgi:hypothetical protein